MSQFLIRKCVPLSLFLALASFQSLVFAQEPCPAPAGRFASIEGQIHIQSGEQQGWRPARLADKLCKGDTVRVGVLSRAALVLVNEAVMRLDQNTTIRLTDISAKKEERSLLDLVKGAIKTFIRKPRLLSVNTPYLNGSIEGTEFQVRVAQDRASILVLEGRILASNEQGKVVVTPGEAAEASAGSAPVARTVVKPRDAVQWTLYYPPILASSGGASDAAARFAALDQVAESSRDAAYYVDRAALLLSVGRQEEAVAAIDTAQQRDPKAGLAHALRAIIHVVRNEREQALAEAEQGVALNDTAATRIALSYALQAAFHIEAARDSLLAAVKNHPEDALAWARLSELQLMLGDNEQARESAARAASLAPDLARVHLVRGFAALAEYRDGAARTSFERAIEMSPADPMAHLGLGLAQISGGELEAGRGELEVAVALDSNQSLLRAYLGKAYFEERRAPLDAQQFGIARQLDPLDPTAFLYDGIRKQTENRPVEALADLEQSMALNDNRAVYRGRLLLDKDQAARGTSLARVYNDLGFTELGVAEATRSLTTDPANASAHRFLSDSYLGTRRREIARVSELTQAQMLQDLNLNPIQLSTSEANLNIVTAGGPASAGFNEFTPLFQRNQTQVSLAALAGNNDTLGGEVAISGVYDRFSFSLGAFGYDTDGWRPNNGLKQDLYNVFVQAALTDKLNVQAEFRHRKSTEGDLAFNFDPEDFIDDKTIEREQDTTRLGLRYSFTPQSHFLLSYIHGQRNEDQEIVTPGIPDTVLNIPGETLTITDSVQVDEKSNQLEAQFLHTLDAVSYVIGAAWNKTNREKAQVVAMDHSFVGYLFDLLNSREAFSIEHPRAYGYAYLRRGTAFTWTLGASYERFEQDTFKETSFNPKLGVQWDIRPDVQLRAAAFQSVKPALVSNRSLEPTQVAGFNQLYDDRNGTKTRRYGVGMDWRVDQNVKTGAEFSQRHLDEPEIVFTGVKTWITEERKEQWHRLYLDWTPTTRLALHSELVYDHYSSEPGVATEAGLPEKAVTWSLPVSLSYFGPSGFFSTLGATYVNQEVRRSPLAFQASGEDRFVVVDASVGYRFAKRRGVLSLAVKNLFGTEFKYQDDSYREFRDEPSAGPYFPERTVMVRCALGF